MDDTSPTAPPPEPPSSRQEEATLLAALLADDDSAWRLFHSLYAGPIVRAIMTVRNQFPCLMNGDDVRDVYAELCLQLLRQNKRRLRQFETTRGIPLRAWLDVLARNAAYDFLRSRRRQPEFRGLRDDLAEATGVVADASDPFGICCARERARMVAALLAELPPRDREFVVLYYGEGLDPAETAERLGICVSTVYSKKHKIRARIESLLEKRWAA